MPLGVIEIRDVQELDGRGRNRKVKKPFIAGTDYEITSDNLRTSGWGTFPFSLVNNGLDIEYDVVNGKVANVRRYAAVPAGVRRILESRGCDHPGLALDKLIYRSADQSFVNHALQKIIEVNNAVAKDVELYRQLLNRWKSSTNQLKAFSSFRCTTTGPLTLHLARASALENAGICLHPLYGFAYLPGSGLKGMARAYAETIWLPVQSDPKKAWRQIEDVFGWAPNFDRRQQINDPDHPAEVRRQDEHDPESPEITASSGNIVFHDAWPESWPKLTVDIVNNHHPHYYTGETSNRDELGRCTDCMFPHDDPNAHPPGDWENPVPVYFLAVKPGTTFTFLLAKRRADVADEFLKLAQEWLIGALCHLGAGAKTNAGYGAFKLADDKTPELPTQTRKTFEATLELVTPAFLAGANQQAEDCDLRPATLRGLLRWWWRTMHANFVDVKTLRALEAAIWGDTKAGGAVRIVIEKVSEAEPQLYDKRSKAKSDNDHKKSPYGIPSEQDAKKITPGLWYVSYGMDETSKGQRKQRHYLEPGERWRLRLIARPTRFFVNRKDADDPKKVNEGKRITADQVLSQAKAALWLLCHFGGVGSKARKGFGSLTAKELADHGLEACQKEASELRKDLGLPNDFDDSRAHSSSLQQMLKPVQVTFQWPDVWSVLDQIGFAYQAFAKKYRHKREKMALGLPRRIGPPEKGEFSPEPPVTPNGRHSSPVHIHIETKCGNYIVRVVAFPAAHLPDLAMSRKFLEEFLKDIKTDLERRARLQPLPFGSSAPTHSTPGSSPSTSGPTLPKAGDRVEARLLEEKTKKGGWKAQHIATGLSGPIQNTSDVPGDKKAGDTVTLIVASANEREIAFRYPTATDQQHAHKQPGKSKRA